MNKKYKKSELIQILKNCDINQICRDVYNALTHKSFIIPYKHTDESMLSINNLIDRLHNSGKFASIQTIYNDIICICIHSSNIKTSISEIWFTLKDTVTENGMYYKIIDKREIYDLISEDDLEYNHHSKTKSASSFI